jgi:hypothetical protein
VLTHFLNAYSFAGKTLAEVSPGVRSNDQAVFVTLLVCRGAPLPRFLAALSRVPINKGGA